MTGSPAAGRSPALYTGAALWRVVCPGALGINRLGGRPGLRQSFRPEGALGADSHELQL